MSSCLNCGEDTKNPKYCSKSCSASVNNSASPKRKQARTCRLCTSPRKSWRHDYCAEHQPAKRLATKDKTIGEYRNRLSVKGKHPSWLNAHVRGFARSWLKYLTEEPCRHCGYDKHVELAHIKGLTEFEDDATLGLINSEENVLPLCPNCHWEFDNLPRK